MEKFGRRHQNERVRFGKGGIIMGKIIYLIVLFGIIGFLLFYALPQMVKSRRQFKKQMAEVKTEMEETGKILNLCMPIFKGTATDADIAAFQAYRYKWEEKHGPMGTYKS